MKVQANHVLSSNIDRIGYSDTTLYVSFKSGGIYSYADVPHDLFLELLAAESIGRFFHARIKGQYAFQKLDTDPFA
jgi:hypothetical protein